MTKRQKSSEEAKTPDAFLSVSDRILNWIEARRVLVGVGAGAVLLLGLAWLGIDQWGQFQERRAASSIYRAEAKITAKREEFAKQETDRLEAIAKEMTKDKGKGAKKEMPVLPPPPAKIDFDSTYAALAKDLEKEIEAHRGTNAAAVAALKLVGLYLTNQKAELADAFLAKIQKVRDDSLDALMRTQKATVAMEVGDFPRAASTFEALAKDRHAQFLRPDALLKLGVCQHKMGKLEEAKGTFERITAEFGDSEAGRSAKSYLRLMQLESGPQSTAGKG